jgi:hypothetical protein
MAASASFSIITTTLAKRLRKLEALAARPGTPGEGTAARAAIARLKAHLPPPSLSGNVINYLGRRCSRCGGVNFTAGPASGPHAARLDCSACGAFAGWLPRAKADELLREVAT